MFHQAATGGSCNSAAMRSPTEDGLAHNPSVRKQHLRMNKYNPPDISILCSKQVALGGIAVMVCHGDMRFVLVPAGSRHKRAYHVQQLLQLYLRVYPQSWQVCENG